MDFIQLYHNFQWFFSLGYVTIIAIILTMVTLELIKVTVLKKKLATYSPDQKDKLLSGIGTVLAFIFFAICHFGNEMILQGKFMIDFDKAVQSISIPTGAIVTWTASKGLYTMIHKAINRCKAKKSLKEQIPEIAEELDEVRQQVEEAKSTITTERQLGAIQNQTFEIKKIVRNNNKKDSK